ncbi:MAG: Mur ligase family protein [Patescibacteria group bacterium]|nr:Mur ligase family protein [Patescibacteria group bacterium]
MKKVFKLLLKYYLKYITKFVLLIHRPTIIAIAGSTNKTFVKEEVCRVLRALEKNVRANPRSFNTEIGLPLAILYLPSGYNSYKNWLPIIFKSFLAIFQRDFPQYLVLELGVSEPGDMKYLLSIIKPRLAIITDITQRYLESFSDMDRLVGEYERLVKKVKKNGLVALNYDNIRIRNLAKVAKAPVEFFGLQNGAHWQAVKINSSAILRGKGRSSHYNFSEGGEEQGQTIKVSHNNIVKKYKIKYFGKHHIYSLLIGLIIKNYVTKHGKNN